jgi:predicted site-specific integrase-resolvase
MDLVAIGEAARELRVHPDTLKRWETAGRVRPLRDHRGARFYCRRDLDRLRRWREPSSPVSRAQGRDAGQKAGRRPSASSRSG